MTNNKSLIKDLLAGKLNCCVEAAEVIKDQDEEIAELKASNAQIRSGYAAAEMIRLEEIAELRDGNEYLLVQELRRKIKKFEARIEEAVGVIFPMVE